MDSNSDTIFLETIKPITTNIITLFEAIDDIHTFLETKTIPNIKDILTEPSDYRDEENYNYLYKNIVDKRKKINLYLRQIKKNTEKLDDGKKILESCLDILENFEKDISQKRVATLQQLSADAIKNHYDVPVTGTIEESIVDSFKIHFPEEEKTNTGGKRNKTQQQKQHKRNKQTHRRNKNRKSKRRTFCLRHPTYHIRCT